MKSSWLTAVLFVITLSCLATPLRSDEPVEPEDEESAWQQLERRAVSAAAASIVRGDDEAALRTVEGDHYLLRRAWVAAIDLAAQRGEPAVLLRVCDGYFDRVFIWTGSGSVDADLVLRRRASAVLVVSKDEPERAAARAWLAYTHARDKEPWGKDKPLLQTLRTEHPRSDYVASLRIAEALELEDAAARRDALAALAADESLSGWALAWIEAERYELATRDSDWPAAHAISMRTAQRPGPVMVRRAALRRAANAASYSDDPDTKAKAPDLFRACIETYPDSKEAEIARVHLIHHYTSHGRTREAIDAMGWIERHAPADADLSAPLLVLAYEYYTDGNVALSRAAYRSIVERYGSVEAMVQLGEFAAEAGDHAKAVEWWKKAVAVEQPAATLVFDHDAATAIGNAQSALANYYMDRGEWVEAARWWKAWTPHHWCGTCLDGIESEKPRMIARCLLEAEMDEEFLATVEPAIWSDEQRGWGGQYDLYLEYHRRRGKLDALNAKAEAVKRDPTSGERAVGSAELIMRRIDFDPILRKGDPDEIWRAYLPIRRMDDGYSDHPRYGSAYRAVGYLEEAMVELGEPMRAFLAERAAGDTADALIALDRLAEIDMTTALPMIRQRLARETDAAESADRALMMLVPTDNPDALAEFFRYVDNPSHPLHKKAKSFADAVKLERPQRDDPPPTSPGGFK